MVDDVAWPALPLAPWRDTCETLHRYVQIVGKIREMLSAFFTSTYDACAQLAAWDEA